ncbi:MAG: hypothetical protein QM723_01515 [Myxococcaceae bacterium]
MYRYTDEGCYACHAAGDCTPFDHAGVTQGCAACHDVNQAFAALPVTGFTHPDMLGSDCGACHTPSTSCHQNLGWPDAGNAVNKSDPARDYSADEYLPTWAGTSIVSLTPQTEALPQLMNHGTTALPMAVTGTCTTCHLDAPVVYYPGDLHSSLANAVPPIAEPASCTDCHAVSMPAGFVGPFATSPARTPPGPEMKHDAVAWANGAPGTTQLVTQDCAVCHTSPSAAFDATWALNPAATGPAVFHASLALASQPQPASCLDCHANTRPSGNVTSGAISFDHSLPAASGDCAACHAASAPGFTVWSGGLFHAVAATTPTTCVPCHEGERPATTAGWLSSTYQQSPFDYGTNGSSIVHGDGQDCALCHSGSTSTWATGHLDHASAQVTQTTCIACHSTQRPDLVIGRAAADAGLNFDHFLDGTGDCFGCHQATVTAGTYVNYFKAGTSVLPGGDWQGGQKYPGAVLVSAPSQFITLNEITLQRGSNNLITGMTSQQTTLYNAMLHTSAAIPSQVSPGPAGAPDLNSCWHCHTNTAGTVTSYSNGQFHSSLTNYRATPGGTVMMIGQPMSGCTDCHSQMRPNGIVQLAGASIQSMDHHAPMNGLTLDTLDCSTCHAGAGTTWANGKLHPNLGSATPVDCAVCHYPLMADAAKADVAQTTNFTMKHRSAQMTIQKCDTCHTTAFSQAKNTPTQSTLWATGAYHVSLSAQPTLCNDCHLASEPAANASTQSSVTYAFSLGGTATNGAQWMNHGSTFVAGKDCSVCHRNDAKASGSQWLKSDTFHSQVANVTACQVCHGLTNGGSSTAGNKNNLPGAITNSSYLTTASQDSTTGVPAGTHDQIDHTDVNVTAHDCNFCHTQVGPGSGSEWAQAAFHKNFNSSNPLNTNGTTGRCSHCHLNVKPGTGFTAQAHAAFTNASGSTDCASCHSWPGTGGTSSPNWLGAVGGAPATISVGGFTVTNPPASNNTTVQAGIANLPHPAVGSQACSVCHTGGVGGRPAIGYDHASTLINNHCNSCHEDGSDLVGTPWNGTTGNTRPYNFSPVVANKGGDHCTLSNNYQHFYPTDCYQCHGAPTGTVNATTGTTYTTRWKFNHTESRMTNSATCNYCHGSANHCPK